MRYKINIYITHIGYVLIRAKIKNTLCIYQIAILKDNILNTYFMPQELLLEFCTLRTAIRASVFE